jgi:DNA-directed RNA polymerase subunit beta'
VPGADGSLIVLNKNGASGIYDEEGPRTGAPHHGDRRVISVADGGRSRRAKASSSGIRTTCRFWRAAGVVEFHDFIEGVTVRKEVDEATGLEGTVVWSTRRICIRRS